MATGGTAADFWHDRAVRARAAGRPGDAPDEPAAERYERLYSAAARMLAVQGPTSARRDWSQDRRASIVS